MFRYWLNQNNSKIQLINLASLNILRFWGHIHEAIEFGHVGMMCIIFINVLSTVSSDIFIGTVKQIVTWCFTPSQPLRLDQGDHQQRSNQITPITRHCH